MSILVGATSGLAGAAGAAGGADLGDTIEQSLRFSGSQLLTTTRSSAPTAASTNEYCFSMWVKFAGTNASTHAVIAAGSRTSAQLQTNTASDNQMQWIPSSHSNGSTLTTTAHFRDYSGWYHLHGKYDPGNTSTSGIYINGSLVSTTPSNVSTNGSSNSWLADNTILTIGFIQATINQSFAEKPYEGYIAEVHFIDGQALDPTSFARTNDAGVWVPRTYSGTYGNNGFHLTFDSSQTNGIGHDSSGNGNHFTATGFDTSDVVLYSKDLYTASDSGNLYGTLGKNFASSQPAAQAFDGQTSSRTTDAAEPSTTNRWVVYKPASSVNVSTSLRVYTRNYQGNATYSINGGDEQSMPAIGGGGGSSYGWADLSFTGTLTEFGVKDHNSTTIVFAIEIDGTVLVDNIHNDVDFNDTPTSNYTLINQLNSNASTISEANLRTTGDAGNNLSKGSIGSQAVSSGKYYWEVLVNTVGHSFIGVTPSRHHGVGGKDLQYQDDTITYKYNGQIQEGDGSTNVNVTSYGNSWSAGDIIGVALDLDNDAIYFSLNGTFQNSGDPTSGSTKTGAGFTTFSGAYSPVAAGFNSFNCSLNFGQMPFVHTKPTGYSALQTANHAEPTIKNGKEHFDVVTYTGNGSTQTITGLEFQPDLIWAKARSVAYHHVLTDSVRGASKSLNANLTNAEQTQSTSFVQSFNSDGWTMGDSATGTGGMNTNNDTYVAYCWKAGTSYTPTLSGFTAATASINTEAGFGIYALTGANTASSFTHGLDSTPEVIICKNRDDAEDWVVFSPKTDGPPTATDTYLRFNEQTDANKNGTQILTGNTSTTVSVASFNETASDDDYIYYLWHSVEGFSKIGRYQGNGSSDGPFVYCGFRPAFVMVKGVTTTNGWGLYDSARFENNPVNGLLYANSSNVESAFVNRPMDFLANGFKCRDSNTNLNASTSYMFMAFAEFPFGGENVPPATAR